MRKIASIIKAELVLFWGQMKSYKFDFILYSLDTYLLFMGIFVGMGVRLFSGRGTIFMIIGMVFWIYSIMSIQTVSGIIQGELRRGTFEQILMTRTSLILLIACKFVVKLLNETLQIVAIILLLVITLGFSKVFDQSINIPFLLVILLVTIAGLFGVGYSIAGLSMIFKRVGAIARATSNFFLFFSGLVIPLTLVPKHLTYVSYAFPFFWGMRAIEAFADNGAALQYFCLLVVTSCLWLLIGTFTFKRCMRISMAKGLTSHY